MADTCSRSFVVELPFDVFPQHVGVSLGYADASSYHAVLDDAFPDDACGDDAELASLAKAFMLSMHLRDETVQLFSFALPPSQAPEMHVSASGAGRGRMTRSQLNEAIRSILDSAAAQHEAQDQTISGGGGTAGVRATPIDHGYSLLVDDSEAWATSTKHVEFEAPVPPTATPAVFAESLLLALLLSLVPAGSAEQMMQGPFSAEVLLPPFTHVCRMRLRHHGTETLAVQIAVEHRSADVAEMAAGCMADAAQALVARLQAGAGGGVDAPIEIPDSPVDGGHSPTL
ncbi:hypothetical protein HK105_203977 [Polyrhizophydium stewartii]|uniref:Uncharacterized protein n=1 Tax=Polyrhizophydium stewartii TaxID=2732419 RepID=A0ABR4NAP9_9FUNG